MKSLKLLLMFFSVTALFIVFFSCSKKADNPLKTSDIGILEQPQLGDEGGSYRMTPLEPFVPHVVRSVEWIKWDTATAGCGGMAFDGNLIWLGGREFPWYPFCGQFYGITFHPSLEKHFSYGQLWESIGLTWDGNYLRLSKGESGLSTRISKLTTEGVYISHFIVPFRATGLAWDGNYLWAIDYYGGNFKKLNSSGIVIDSIIPETPISPIVGLAFDGESFWCSNGGKIYKMSQEGSILQSFNQPGATVSDLAWCGQCLLILDTSSGYNKIFVVQVSRCNCPLKVFEHNSAD